MAFFLLDTPVTKSLFGIYSTQSFLPPYRTPLTVTILSQADLQLGMFLGIITPLPVPSIFSLSQCFKV